MDYFVRCYDTAAADRRVGGGREVHWSNPLGLLDTRPRLPLLSLARTAAACVYKA